MMAHLYIHIPFCDGKCNYCGFYSLVKSPALTILYSTLPANEWAELCLHHHQLCHTHIRTLYMGGGTPTMLGSEGLKRLVKSLRNHLSLQSLTEWTVELNPRSATPEILATLRSLGVNRLTIGAQSFDDATLRRMGRRHSADDTVQTVRLAKSAGFHNIGLDLIAGFPGVTAELWQDTLARALALNIQHLSIYALSIEPGTRLSQQVEQGLKIPDDDQQLAALTQAETLLTHHGLQRYEISNYALPGAECQHNLGIWRGQDYIGLGPAAASRLGRTRWTNIEELSDYINATQKTQRPPRREETLSPQDDALERVLFALRLAEGLNPTEAMHRFPVLRAHAEKWPEKLQALARQGITTRQDQAWCLSPRGREVCDAVIKTLL